MICMFNAQGEGERRGGRQWELMRVDRPERWRSYEKMIEGGLLGGSEGKETDGVREEGEEGFKDPQQAVIEMDWFCRQMIRWNKIHGRFIPANRNSVWVLLL